jgi:hypothetical protein
MVSPDAPGPRSFPREACRSNAVRGYRLYWGGEAWARLAQARRTIWFMPGRLLLGHSERSVTPACAARRRQRLLVPREATE